MKHVLFQLEADESYSASPPQLLLLFASPLMRLTFLIPPFLVLFVIVEGILTGWSLVIFCRFRVRENYLRSVLAFRLYLTPCFPACCYSCLSIRQVIT